MCATIALVPLLFFRKGSSAKVEDVSVSSAVVVQGGSKGTKDLGSSNDSTSTNNSTQPPPSQASLSTKSSQASLSTAGSKSSRNSDSLSAARSPGPAPHQPATQPARRSTSGTGPIAPAPRQAPQFCGQCGQQSCQCGQQPSGSIQQSTQSPSRQQQAQQAVKAVNAQIVAQQRAEGQPRGGQNGTRRSLDVSTPQQAAATGSRKSTSSSPRPGAQPQTRTSSSPRPGAQPQTRTSTSASPRPGAQPQTRASASPRPEASRSSRR